MRDVDRRVDDEYLCVGEGIVGKTLLLTFDTVVKIPVVVVRPEDVLPPVGASGSVNETPVLDELALLAGLEYVVPETLGKLLVILEVEIVEDEIRLVGETE